MQSAYYNLPPLWEVLVEPPLLHLPLPAQKLHHCVCDASQDLVAQVLVAQSLRHHGTISKKTTFLLLAKCQLKADLLADALEEPRESFQ